MALDGPDRADAGALFTEAELTGAADAVEAAASKIESSRHESPLAFLDLPDAYHDGPEAKRFDGQLVEAWRIIGELADEIRQCRGDLLHLGIGGSALGAITLRNAVELGRAGDDDAHPRVFIPDNVDPEWMRQILERVEPDRTYINVVSKSGGTVETIANFAVAYRFLLQRGIPADELRRRIVVTTNPHRGPLKDLAAEYGFRLLPLPDEIHGRFSVLSPVGLLVAAVCGGNMDELLTGAREADEVSRTAAFGDNLVKLVSALHWVGDTKKGLRELVLLPYTHALRTMADWYSQLAAESLGKDGKGVTPIKALGATDQHSQLQLYNDGPRNKLIMFFTVRRFRADLEIPDVFTNTPGFAYLRDHSLHDLLSAEQRATAVSLTLNGVPNCVLELSEINERNMGALFMYLEKVVAVLGELYGVNAFNQPGVEESKQYARAMLGMAGEAYDTLRATVAMIERGGRQRAGAR
jgi:glucose-6-phosphate isomerase